MESVAEEFETFRTNDMAMATYLRMQGHAVQRVYWDSGTCYWTFVMTDVLYDQMSDFQEDNALVNPKEFTRHYGITKQEFYSKKPA